MSQPKAPPVQPASTNIKERIEGMEDKVRLALLEQKLASVNSRRWVAVLRCIGGIAILVPTAAGIAFLAWRVLGGTPDSSGAVSVPAIGKSQAVVLCVAVVGLVAVAFGGLLALSRGDDGWR